MLSFNLLVMLVMLVALVFSLLIENYLLSAFFAAMAAFYGYLSWQQRRLSVTQEIERDRIEAVEFRPAVPGQARASFAISFRNGRGRLLTRILSLPTASEQGNMVVQSALLIMKEEGLVTEGQSTGE
jgi:hypothetical protein